MRLPRPGPLPGPRDLWLLLERGGDTVEQLLAAVPRLVAVVGAAEDAVRRADSLIERIEQTRRSADVVVARTDQVVTRADGLLTTVDPMNARLKELLDALEPSLVKLQPIIERLAETTDAREVDALVELIDHLPQLANKMETDVLPVLDSMSSVAPDLHDLLDASRELNEMLAQIPGMGRVMRRIDEEQAAEGRG